MSEPARALHREPRPRGPQDPPATEPEPAFAVVLAAGLSRRFGDEPKLDAHLDGRALLRRICEAVRDCSADDAVVVLGAEAETLRPHVEATGLSWVINPDSDLGQSTSIRRGLEEAPPGAGVLLTVADQPFLEASHVDRVLGIGRETARIARARAGSLRGSPVWFPRRLRHLLDDLEGDEGARQIFRRLGPDSDLVVDVDLPPAALVDVDSLEDLRRLRDAP